MSRKVLLLSLTAIAILACGFLIQNRSGNLPIDQEFKIIDGRSITLQSLIGKPVLINFWSTTCTICIEEMPDLISLYEDYKTQGFELISVTMPYDRPDLVLKVNRDKKLPFPVALDVNGDVDKAFGGIKATPTHILINKEGKQVDRFVGRIDPAKLRTFLDEQFLN